VQVAVAVQGDIGGENWEENLVASSGSGVVREDGTADCARPQEQTVECQKRSQNEGL
jgi:hypothetical protein